MTKQLSLLILMLTVSVIGVSTSACASGENLLLFETDFETSVDGWYGFTPYSTPPVRVRDGMFGNWCLERRGSETLRSSFTWDCLTNRAAHTLSFYAKGTGGGAEVCILTEKWKWIACRRFNVSQNWRRVVLDVRPPAGDFGRAFYVFFRRPGVNSDAWMRIDGVKLERGTTATVYEPPAIQFHAALCEPGEIHFEEDGPPVIKVRVAGSAVASTKAKLAVEVLDGKGNVRTSGVLGDDLEVAIPLDFARFSGYYPFRTRLVDTSGKQLCIRNSPFVVTRRNVRGNSFFGVQFGPGVTAAALRRVGFEWTRANTKFWQHEEKDGPRVFTGTDAVEARRADAFMTLGTTWGPVAPKWALGSGRTRWTDDPRKATSFLQNLVHVTTNVVDQYEIINEPDLTLPHEKGVTFDESIEYYANVVKTCAEHIRPTGKPVVVDVSGVADGNRFLEGVLARVPESVDIVSSHSYCWPRELSEDGRVVSDPETGGFLDDLRNKTTLIAKYGKRRLSVGELGWALDMAAPYPSRSMAKFAWYLSRMYLLARSFDEVEYLIWYSLANAPELGLFDYGLWRCTALDGTRPTAAVAAACEASRQIPMHGAGRVSRIMDNGVYLLKWERESSTCYAYWTDEPMNIAMAGLAVRSVSARSCLGAPLAVDHLTLSESPVYLEVGEGCETDFEKALRSALDVAYSKRTPPVREEIAVHKYAGTDWRTDDVFSGDGLLSMGKQRRDIMPPDPTVQWNGPDDLSVRMRLSWDATNFYFFALVRDDFHSVRYVGADMYKNDAIQFAFDPLDNAKRNAGYMSDDCEFGMCEGQPLWAWRLSGKQPGAVDGDVIRVTRHGKETEYRAAIPWSMFGLLQAPEKFGFAVAILDNDDGGRARYWIALGHGIVDGKRPARFKRLLLVP